MKCSKSKFLLSTQLDGEVSPSEELALEQHIAKCAACAQERADLMSLSGTMSLWVDEEPSEWLAQNFSYKLKEIMQENRTEKPQPVRRRWGILGPASAGLATALLLVVMVMHNQAPQPVAPTVSPAPPVVATSSTPAKPGPEIAVKPETSPAPKTAVALAEPTPAPIVRHTAKRTTQRTNVAVNPTPAPEQFAKSDAQPMMDSAPYAGKSMTLAAPSAPTAITAAVTVVDGVQASGEDKVKDNIGEAGLAMNENMEKLRGTLREAVDLLVSRPPMPATSNTDSNGGSNP